MIKNIYEIKNCYEALKRDIDNLISYTIVDYCKEHDISIDNIIFYLDYTGEFVVSVSCKEQDEEYRKSIVSVEKFKPPTP